MYYNTNTQTFGHTYQEVVAKVGYVFPISDVAIGDFVCYEEAQKPVFNPLTEKLVPSVNIAAVHGRPWQRQWDVIPLDAAESAAKLTAAQHPVRELIKAERDRRSDNGGYKVAGKWFHSDQRSKTQQMGLMLMGAGMPVGLQWKTMDGSFVTMTTTLAQQIFAAAAAADQAVFAACEIHIAAMMASPAPHLYNWQTGWPQTYQESVA